MRILIPWLSLTFLSIATLGVSRATLHAQDPGPCLTVLECPEEVLLATSGLGTTADLSVFATNACISSLTVRCYLVNPSGALIRSDTVFPLGTNLVECRVMDETGLELTNCSFQVVVLQDQVPPLLVKPPRLIVPCTEPGGATVSFTAGAIDNLDPQPSVVCDPPSGSFFASGTNRVTCTARDEAGNRTVESFDVIVSGGCEISRCLDLVTPDDIRVPCESATGTKVEYSVTARDTCQGVDLEAVCDPPSGTLFPVGITRVVCRVDQDGIIGGSSFLIEVSDTVPPTMQCPSNLVVQAESPRGIVVEYSVSATDDCTDDPKLRCAPASGSVFPVGETRVYCEAADESGNASQCVFVVTVLPPRPFEVSHLAEGRLELKWSGDAVPQVTEFLGADAVWADIEAPPVAIEDGWHLVLPMSEKSQYFRLRLLPLLPPSDRDGDGVIDGEDRCPDTPVGLPVDETGCATFDFVATPGLALREDEDQLRRLRTQFSRWPSTATLAQFIPPSDDATTGLKDRLLERDYEAAAAESSFQVVQLERTLTELIRVRMERLEELSRLGPFQSEDYADVRNADHELLDLIKFEEMLTESLWRYRQLGWKITNILHAIEVPPPRERVQIVSLDNVRGVAYLADGRAVLLPRFGTMGTQPLDTIEDAMLENDSVDMVIAELTDGSSLAVEAVAVGEVSTVPVAQLNPRRLELRVTPVDFGLPESDLAPRLRLEAYRWGFTETSSRLYLEFNQALAVVPYLSLPGRPEYEHWVKIDADTNNDGNYWALVMKMTPNSPPYVLRKDNLPGFNPFSLRVREFRRPFDEPGSTAEMVYEEYYVVELNDPGTYVDAEYDRRAFELEDESLNSGFQIAQVLGLTPYFPLTLKPVHELSFSGTSFKATTGGGGSTYPNVGKIGFNEWFTVHNDDPNDHLWFANPADLPNGIYRPTVSGFNNGHEFNYRARLPLVVRDRLYDCPGSSPDTYYKIPFKGSYTVSQGNNGDFTHNGWQTFAWDFPKPAFTPILAARGGVVVDLRKSSNQSCYNPFIPNSNGTQGDCVNCTGSASANYVYIRHQDGTFAWYGHFRNQGVVVSMNQRVFRGDFLGVVGNTGCSSGNHLHFHVVNPIQSSTIPVRFESYIFNGIFNPCYLPPSNSAGQSTF